jgi:hypothetical protein
MKLVLTSWRPGLKKISLSTLLVTRANLKGLDAFESVDRLIAGEVIEVEIESADAALNLKQELEAIGVVCHIESLVDRDPEAIGGLEE